MRFLVSGAAAWLSVLPALEVTLVTGAVAEPEAEWNDDEEDDDEEEVDFSDFGAGASAIESAVGYAGSALSSLVFGAGEKQKMLARVQTTVSAAYGLWTGKDAVRLEALTSAIAGLSYEEKSVWHEFLRTPGGEEFIRSRVKRLRELELPDTAARYWKELQALLPPALAEVVYGEAGFRDIEQISEILKGVDPEECMEIITFAHFKLQPIEGSNREEMIGKQRALEWVDFNKGSIDSAVARVVTELAVFSKKNQIDRDGLKTICMYHMLPFVAHEQSEVNKPVLHLLSLPDAELEQKGVAVSRELVAQAYGLIRPLLEMEKNVCPDDEACELGEIAEIAKKNSFVRSVLLVHYKDETDLLSDLPYNFMSLDSIKDSGLTGASGIYHLYATMVKHSGWEINDFITNFLGEAIEASSVEAKESAVVENTGETRQQSDDDTEPEVAELDEDEWELGSFADEEEKGEFGLDGELKLGRNSPTSVSDVWNQEGDGIPSFSGNGRANAAGDDTEHSLLQGDKDGELSHAAILARRTIPLGRRNRKSRVPADALGPLLSDTASFVPASPAFTDSEDDEEDDDAAASMTGDDFGEEELKENESVDTEMINAEEAKPLFSDLDEEDMAVPVQMQRLSRSPAPTLETIIESDEEDLIEEESLDDESEGELLTAARSATGAIAGTTSNTASGAIAGTSQQFPGPAPVQPMSAKVAKKVSFADDVVGGESALTAHDLQASTNSDLPVIAPTSAKQEPVQPSPPSSGTFMPIDSPQLADTAQQGAGTSTLNRPQALRPAAPAAPGKPVRVQPIELAPKTSIDLPKDESLVPPSSFESFSPMVGQLPDVAASESTGSVEQEILSSVITTPVIRPASAPVASARADESLRIENIFLREKGEGKLVSDMRGASFRREFMKLKPAFSVSFNSQFADDFKLLYANLDGETARREFVSEAEEEIVLKEAELWSGMGKSSPMTERVVEFVSLVKLLNMRAILKSDHKRLAGNTKFTAITWTIDLIESAIAKRLAFFTAQDTEDALATIVEWSKLGSPAASSVLVFTVLLELAQTNKAVAERLGLLKNAVSAGLGTDVTSGIAKTLSNLNAVARKSPIEFVSTVKMLKVPGPAAPKN